MNLKLLFCLMMIPVFVSCNKPETPATDEKIDPNTIIEYTSYHGNRVEPSGYKHDTTTFGAIIVSNTCQEGMINSPGTIKFDNPVTHIGDNAFYNSSLSSITIPDSVTFIGDYAFCGTHLSSIILPNSIISIGQAAFRVTEMTNITVPDSVTSIGAYAFSYNGLISIILPNSLTSIEEGTFLWCDRLRNITFGKNIRTIGNEAFYRTGFSAIEIPDSVTSIGEKAFAECEWLGRVVLGKNVKTIGKDAFGKCKRLLGIYCKTQEPPILGSELALGDPQNSKYYKIYVPKGAVDAYKSAWPDYSDNIVGYDFDTL